MKRQMRWASLVSLSAAIASGAIGCLGDQSEDTTTTVGAVSLGGALPGTNASQFAAAEANFIATETQADGLGPDLQRAQLLGLPLGRRDRRRRTEHRARYGTINSNGTFNWLAATGGSLRQLFGIGGYNPEPGPQLPVGHRRQSRAGRHDLRRPRDDADLRRRAGRAHSGLDDPRRLPARSRAPSGAWRASTPSISPTVRSCAGSRTWRASAGRRVHASVTEFAADAYMNEMGITTTSCAAGTVVTDFATENRANRAGTNAIINGCPDDDVPGVDDDSGQGGQQLRGRPHRAAGRRRQLRLLHAQPGAAAAAASPTTATARGLTVFNREGCNGCHVGPTTFTVDINGQNQPSFQPFSDFLVHDMGTLGDGIGLNDGDSSPQQRAMRTAPLWGLRFRNVKSPRRPDHEPDHRHPGARGPGAAAAAAFSAATSTQKNNAAPGRSPPSQQSDLG